MTSFFPKNIVFANWFSHICEELDFRFSFSVFCKQVSFCTEKYGNFEVVFIHVYKLAHGNQLFLTEMNVAINEFILLTC